MFLFLLTEYSLNYHFVFERAFLEEIPVLDNPVIHALL